MSSEASARLFLAGSVALAAGLLLFASSASAHNRSMSWSTWTFDEGGGARVELRIKLLELTRRAPGFDWEDALPRELTMRAGGAPCPAERARRARPAPEGWAIFHWQVRCQHPSARAIENALLLDAAATHTHFIRVEVAAQQENAEKTGGRERVLVTGSNPSWLLDAASDGERADSSLQSFLVLGVQHIATGWDHLAFVIALLLVAGSLREVAGLVTGFTVAHSLTLGLAVLGVVRPESVGVEILIGYSIALVAAENSWLLGGRDRWVPAAVAGASLAAAGLAFLGWGELDAIAWAGLALFAGCHFALLRRSARPARLRGALAFAFGLVHGFGFAGILMELELPAARLVPALFGFNVGVELGQLAVVVLVWPLLFSLARFRAPWRRGVAEAGSAAIFALGLYWVLVRNFG